MTRRQSPVAGQLDLFGEAPTEEAARDAGASRRERFTRRACFDPDGTPVIWTAAWDCADGTPKGAQRPGWRCWHCGGVEVNESLLQVNHGLHADQDTSPADTDGCLALWLRGNHERFRRQREQARRHH